MDVLLEINVYLKSDNFKHELINLIIVISFYLQACLLQKRQA